MDDIRGLKPYILFSPDWKLFLLAGAVFVALAVLLSYLLRAQDDGEEEIEDALPADALASVKQQLEALQASGLAEAGRSQEFHGRLSALMRGYLGQHFALPGRRLTTTELLALLEPLPLESALYDLVADFLLQCDLVKFADAPASAQEMGDRLALACHVIDRLGDAALPVEEADVVG